MLSVELLPVIQKAIAAQGADGWLLYDFRRTNPIATEMMGLEGLASRRVFAWVPVSGAPVAITHAIEQGEWVRWPSGWGRRVYASWRSFEAEVASLVAGKTVLMEYSPGDAVPVVDRVPAGIVDLVRASGATVRTSAELISQFFAAWTPAQYASHVRAAEIVARIARAAFPRAGAAVRAGTAMHEHELNDWIKAEFIANGLFTDHGPNVSASENAANPHYEPSADHPRALTMGDTILIDLWATEPDGGIYADQTWMGCIGEPSPKLRDVWTVVRDARDAAIELIRARVAAGQPVRGADADDAARGVIEKAGYGQYFTHRTGHSIDVRALHGSGPNLDNLETREERLLIPGVGFSIEPGVYLPGEIGVRSEVNAFIGADGLVITPVEIQRELFVV
ncbi:MAG: aminopeptidase P family protein [Gemmatimonadetes bacterium]|nr:aminopeptidase P family protein [Gemmatimonadota bacterium]MBI3569086.1 aminopeptidase P family protein [Gemmatimonadota bacterium]